MRDPAFSATTPRVALLLLCGLSVVALTRCDTSVPARVDTLVVEAFFDAGQPLPPITVRQPLPIDRPYDDAAALVTGAVVTVMLDQTRIAYADAAGQPGVYEPLGAADLRVPAGATVQVEVAWDGQRVRATDTIPPPIRLDSAWVRLDTVPVAAVFSDTLGIRFDSLDIDIDIREGFLYLGEVTLTWEAIPGGTDANTWVETQIQAEAPFSSAVVEFFLLTEELQREADIPTNAAGRRSWSGVYAVPVESPGTPLPAHTVRLALLRSGATYARFATSRNAPERSEPTSNLDQGIGIVAGIAVDTLRISMTSPTSTYPPPSP